MPKERYSGLIATAIVAVWVTVALAVPALLVHRGGRVLSTPQVSTIYLGDYWATSRGASEALHIDAFLQTWIAGPSVTGVLAQYGIGAGSFASSAKVAGAAPVEFTDADAQALLQREIAAGRVARGDQMVYVVYLPPDTVLSFQGNRSQRKLGAYHSSYRDPTTGKPVYYAVVVYNQGANGLDFGGAPQDNISIMTSRVLAGALTNPDVGDVLRGAAPQGVVGWRDDVNGEVGDVAFALSSDPALRDVWVLEKGFAVVLPWSNRDGKLTAGSATATARIGATATGATTLSVSPATQEAAPGATVTYTVTNAATAVAALNISVSGLPQTVTGTLAATSLAAGASTTLTVAVAAGAATGTTTFTVAGTTATTTESASATLTITTTPTATPTPPPAATADFSVSVTPTSQTMTRGGDLVTFTITTQQVGTGRTTVRLNVRHLRRGLKGDLSRTRIAAGETATLTVRAHRDASRRSYEFVLTASGGRADQRVTLTVVVQ